MMQALMITTLCGMIVYFVISYIFIVGLGRDDSKFFTLKCGIIFIGIVFVFFIFRDTADKILPELQGAFSHPDEAHVQFRHFVVIFIGGLVGYIGQILSIKE